MWRIYSNPDPHGVKNILDFKYLNIYDILSVNIPSGIMKVGTMISIDEKYMKHCRNIMNILNFKNLCEVFVNISEWFWRRLVPILEAMMSSKREIIGILHENYLPY
jgi:hypothetical protein